MKPTSESSATGLESSLNSKKQGKGFQCDQCDFDFKTGNGLKFLKGIPNPMYDWGYWVLGFRILGFRILGSWVHGLKEGLIVVVVIFLV